MCSPPTSPGDRRGLAGLSLVAAAGVLGGTGGLTGALLARDAGLSAPAVAAYRLGIGGGLLLLAMAATGRAWPRSRTAWTRVLVMGALAAAYQVAYFCAVALTTVSLATLIAVGASPVLVLAAQRPPHRHRVRGHRDRRLAGAVGLALTGLALLVGLPGGGFGAAAVAGSAALALLAAAVFAAITLLGARPVPGLDELTTTGAGFTFGTLLLTPVAAVTGGLGFTPAPATFGLLLAFGAGPTALAYCLYFRGLRTVAPGPATVLALLEPLTGAVLAALLLGDRLGAAGIGGAVLLAAAMLLAATAPH